MRMDMLLNTMKPLHSQQVKGSKGLGGEKNFANIFNASLKSSTETSASNVITEASTPQPKKNIDTSEVEDQKDLEVIDEGRDQGQKVIYDALHQIQQLIVGLEEELVTLEEAISALPQLIETIEGSLIEGTEIKEMLVGLKEILSDLESVSEKGTLMNLEALPIKEELKVKGADIKDEINSILTGDSEKTIQLSPLDTKLQPQQVSNPQGGLEDGQYMEIGEEPLVTEINLLDKQFSKNKFSDSIEDVELEENVEKPIILGSHSAGETKEYQQVVAKIDDESINLDPKVFIQEVVNKAKILTQNGKSEMRIQLMPENLGSLFINITVDKGNLSAKLFAESQQIKELIESNLEQLKISLGDKGINISKLEVSVGHNQQDFNGSKFLFQQPKGKLKMKRVNQADLVNGLHSMEMAVGINGGNPYLVDSKFNGLA